MTSPPPAQSRRRASTRRLSTVLPPALDSPRTPMPRDDNAFSFLQKYLNDWLLPRSVWDTLPEPLRTKVKNMQHSAAAVLTSLERLDELAKDVPDVIIEDDETENEAISISSMADKTTQDIINAKLVEFQSKRRASEPGSARKEDREKFDCSPIPPEYRSFGSVGETVSSSDLNTPGTNFTGSLSPLNLSQPQSPEATSPVPLDLVLSSARRSSNTVTGPPQNAPTGHYLAQLDDLRKQDVVRLRHSVRAVATEVGFLSKPASPTSSPESSATDTQPMADVDAAFHTWWLEKKALAQSLEGKCKYIEHGPKCKIGWNGAIPYED